MQNTTNKPTPRQTFALFCATGIDWRNRDLTMAQVSAMLDKVMGKKLPKAQAASICEAVLAGEEVADIPSAPTAEAIYNEAHAAGHAAAVACTPRPMTVHGYGQSHFVADGVCGFAWIKIRPARGEFVSYCKRNNIGSTDGYSGGYMIWVHDYNQSMARKFAYAAAFANVLQDHGIKAYAQERID